MTAGVLRRRSVLVEPALVVPDDFGGAHPGPAWIASGGFKWSFRTYLRWSYPIFVQEPQSLVLNPTSVAPIVTTGLVVPRSFAMTSPSSPEKPRSRSQ